MMRGNIFMEGSRMRSKACGLLILLAVGCAAPRMGKPVAKEFAGSDPGAQISFWHALTDEHVASNDQAFHALLLYTDGKDDSASYADRVAALKAHKMLPGNFNESAELGVKRGTLAVAIMRLLRDPGGVTTRVFGPSRRYATRELMFLNVLPPSTPNQVTSGNELVGIIGRVEDFQRSQGGQTTPVVAPGGK
jgi:hypothetical protein